ncbi:Werner Syndrome-like exonuclease isoform X1 [Chenopodium quinoa]|uniref:Werner Syndrome-like exonuclease isoform X1 n=1 Tax=Chenopodium quinoa TaxID=63459 RepID=UPI000B7898BC|nr:Werner Syndrome-like exonuclease isoform X1 [Chenopodium quinoa]
MKNFPEKPYFSSSSTTETTITTTTEFQTIVDDWDKPFSNEELEAIEAAFEAATSTISATPSSSSSSFKTPRSSSSVNGDDDPNTRPTTRRRLPGSISCSNGELGSSPNSGSFALTPCSRNRAFHHQGSVKMKYPALNFCGRIVYSRTTEEVEEATLEILKFLEARKCETGRAVLGLDIEWKPSFDRGIPQGKAAVMQICGGMHHCYVLHIIHSGIPGSLQSLLEDSTYIKVGVGIDNDAVKVFHDHNVSIKSLEDLSSMANQKLGGVPKQWSLSSLVETFTCKQLLKPKKIRLGNWEADPLSKAQLRYAATDAFASWYLYEVLETFSDLPENQKEN